MRFVSLLLSGALAVAVPPTVGPFEVSSVWYNNVTELDATGTGVWLFFPTNASTAARFPLLAYLHGALGGDGFLVAYAAHLERLASWGFVVAAPDSCDTGCTDASLGAPWTDCAGTPNITDSLGDQWGPFYGEALKTIDWARNMSSGGGSADPVFGLIDWSAGVAIAGHSMGGQAAAQAATRACASRWDIRAAALQHAADDVSGLGANLTVPVIGFTSSGDPSANKTEAIMNATRPSLPVAMRNEIGWSHLEPLLAPPVENPLLATYTAAWFKVFINKDTGTFRELIYGSGADSLCQHAPMAACFTRQ